MAEQISTAVYDFNKSSVKSKIPNGYTLGSAKTDIEKLEIYDKNKNKIGFLDFYTTILKMINDYQKAFEEENFERMGEFVKAINQNILHYFENKTSNESDLQNELDDILEENTKKIKNIFNNIKKNKLSNSYVQEQIIDFISLYKEKIINIIKKSSSKSNVFKFSKSEQSNKSEKSNSSESPSQTGNEEKEEFIKKTIDLFENELYGKQNKNNILVYSVKLGQNILKNITDTISKIDKSNINYFKDSINNLHNVFEKKVVNLQKKQINIKVLLDVHLTEHIKTTCKSVKDYLSSCFNVKKYVNNIKAANGKIKTVVSNLFKMTFKLIYGSIRLIFKSIGLLISGTWKLVKFVIPKVFKLIVNIASLAHNLWVKIDNSQNFSFITKAIKTFIFSYQGAYFLGYMSGFIWGKVLRKLGIDTDDIKSGNYNIHDDVLMPFFESLLNPIKKIFGKAKDIGSYMANLGKEILDAFKKTWFYQNIVTPIINFSKDIIEIIKKLIPTVSDFINGFVVPLYHLAYELLNIFFGLDSNERRIVGGAYMGTRIGVNGVIGQILTNVRLFGKSFKIGSKVKGVIGGIVGGALALGVAAITATFFGNGRGKKEVIDGEDGSVKIDSDFNDVYRLKNNKNKTKYEKNNKERNYLRDLADRKKILSETRTKLSFDAFNPLKSNPENNKRKREIWDKIVKLESSLYSEKMNILYYMSIMEELKEKPMRPDDESIWKAGNYETLLKMITFNGENVIGINNMQIFNDSSPYVQIEIINGILEQRANILDEKLQAFKSNIEAYNNGEKSSYDLSDAIDNLINQKNNERIKLNQVISKNPNNVKQDKIDLKFNITNTSTTSSNESPQVDLQSQLGDLKTDSPISKQLSLARLMSPLNELSDRTKPIKTPKINGSSGEISNDDFGRHNLVKYFLQKSNPKLTNEQLIHVIFGMRLKYYLEKQKNFPKIKEEIVKQLGVKNYEDLSYEDFYRLYHQTTNNEDLRRMLEHFHNSGAKYNVTTNPDLFRYIIHTLFDNDSSSRESIFTEMFNEFEDSEELISNLGIHDKNLKEFVGNLFKTYSDTYKDHKFNFFKAKLNRIKEVVNIFKRLFLIRLWTKLPNTDIIKNLINKSFTSKLDKDINTYIENLSTNKKLFDDTFKDVTFDKNNINSTINNIAFIILKKPLSKLKEFIEKEGNSLNLKENEKDTINNYIDSLLEKNTQYKEFIDDIKKNVNVDAKFIDNNNHMIRTIEDEIYSLSSHNAVSEKVSYLWFDKIYPTL